MTTFEDELEEIRKSHEGLLDPHDVVDYAKNPSTLLHVKFEWNDEVASHQYRLWQARHLIRLVITRVTPDEISIPCYVSLKQDRSAEGDEPKGYRHIVEVLKNVALRKTLLDEALAELEAFERKYKTLTELAEIFSATNNVRSKRTK